MLQKAAVESRTLEVLMKLQSEPFLTGFHLAGGTGLALHIGHRISVDLDLFTLEDFNCESLIEQIKTSYDFQVDYIDKNTVSGSIEGIKVDFLTHHYNILRPVTEEDGIRIYSMPDIAAMKINAISSNGTRSKDFVDLYYLFRYFSIPDLLGFYEQKYKQQDSFHAFKSLTYFEEVDLTDWPEILFEIKPTWETIKHTIFLECRDVIK